MGQTEPRSDIYALGATLHATLSGRMPENEYKRLEAQGLNVEQALKALFPPINSLVPNVPPKMVAVVAKATAFRPDDRYPDAIAMGIALGEALGMSPAAATTAIQP
jgi:serine/threonine-protein kinase